LRIQTKVRDNVDLLAGSIRHGGGGTVDLLEVDIERSGLFVFGEGAGPWPRRIGNICIEPHGKDCQEVFFAALKGFDYDLGRFGELTICRDLRPIERS
jgi:hypothetical protein